MIQIIAGEKGKGKTKIVLDKANSEVLTAKGSVIYIDKNSKHMYELNNKIRLINAKDYFITSADAFLGFISGMISQNHDIATIYLDSFLTVANIGISDIDKVFEQLQVLSGSFNVDFVLSVSANAAELPESVKGNVIVSL